MVAPNCGSGMLLRGRFLKPLRRYYEDASCLSVESPNLYRAWSPFAFVQRGLQQCAQIPSPAAPALPDVQRLLAASSCSSC